MKQITQHMDDIGDTYKCRDCQDGDGDYLCESCLKERRYDDIGR